MDGLQALMYKENHNITMNPFAESRVSEGGEQYLIQQKNFVFSILEILLNEG
jgi:hypothetical protein